MPQKRVSAGEMCEALRKKVPRTSSKLPITHYPLKIMRLIDRYILKSFGQVFFFVLFAACSVIVIVDGFERIDYFIDRKAAILQVILHYVYWLPHHVVLILPVAVLLTTLIVIGRLSRNSELIAMKACGLSLWRIFVPLFVVGFMVSLGSLALGELVTVTNHKLTQLKRYDIEKKKRVNYRSQNKIFYLGANGHMYFIDYFDGVRMRLRRVVVYEFDENGLMKRRIDAEKALFTDDNIWVFTDGIERHFLADNSEQVNKFDKLPLPELAETPDDFSRRRKKPKEMNFLELREYVERVKRSGGDVGKDEVDLYLKISFPCANLVILLFGAPLSLSNRRNSPAISIILSISLAFPYWVFIQLGRALGHSGDLSPLIAAWLPNTVFFVLGIVALIRAPK